MITSTTSADHLFVYGTLMMASKHPVAAYLRQRSQLVGVGRFPGQLYNLGAYPGAVYDSQTDQFVYGEVYRMNEPTQLLAELDHYEGISTGAVAPSAEPDEYVRELVPVQTKQGTFVCWTYLYNLPTDQLPLLPMGRYS